MKIKPPEKVEAPDFVRSVKGIALFNFPQADVQGFVHGSHAVTAQGGRNLTIGSRSKRNELMYGIIKGKNAQVHTAAGKSIAVDLINKQPQAVAELVSL